MRRRRMLPLLVALSACARGRPAPQEQPLLAIIYGGDLRGAVAAAPKRGGGLARRATWVDRARLSAPALLQVDAGDLTPSELDGVHPSDAAGRQSRARLALRAYRRMGIDAITPGERDLELGVATWRSLCDEAKVPVVAANLVSASGEPLFPATRLVRAGDVPVGIFGVLDLGSEHWVPPADVRITDAAAAARTAVGALRAQGAQLVIGLFHVAGGLERARQIAAAAGGVDFVALAHSGSPAAPVYGRAGMGGLDVGRLDVSRIGGARHLVQRLLPSTPDVPEQPGVRLLIRLAEGPVAATLAESVAALTKATGVRPYGEGWTYATTALCAGCHPAQAAQWKTTDHAHAYATLQRAGKARDPACMGCHLTGFLQPGGPQNFETAPSFADVGCEACHGPSVAHVVSADKHKGTSRAVAPTVCLGCHTPDQNVGEFSVAAAMKEIVGPGHGAPVTSPR